MRQILAATVAKLAHSTEDPAGSEAIRAQVDAGVRAGRLARVGRLHPALLLAGTLLSKDTFKSAKEKVAALQEVLDKQAARRGAGWDEDGGAQGYAMTPKALGVSGGRLGGAGLFSEMVGQSMRPTFATGMYGGWGGPPRVQDAIASYRAAAEGTYAPSWLRCSCSSHPHCAGGARPGVPKDRRHTSWG
jgi:hypothetical protein